MTETPAAAPKPAAKRHKRPNRKPRVAAAVPQKPPPEFEGLSAFHCCNACKPERCVITGIGICGRGGLQAAMMADPEAVERWERARNFLAKAKIDRAGS